MKKRTNPKSDAMRDRSLMVESERQNSHTTKYSLTEQEENIVGHIINYGEVSLKIEGFKVNGDVLSIFFNPDTPNTTEQRFSNSIEAAEQKGDRLLIELKYNLQDDNISWDFSKLNAYNLGPDDRELEKVMKGVKPVK